ncbi:hypothetical protein CHUAL_005608 [Chamberlinius hualienensis]
MHAGPIGHPNSSRPSAKSTFWSKEKTIPGRASPKKNSIKKTGSGSSFQDFQDSTEDAWDAGDDGEFQINEYVAKSTANEVLSSHINSRSSASSCRLETTQEGKVEAMQRLATQRDLPSEAASGGSPHNKDVLQAQTPHSPNHGPGVGIRLNARHDVERIRPKNNVTQDSRDSESKSAKLEKFRQLFRAPNIDLNELRTLSWSGIPLTVRGTAWRLLSGYLPASLERRPSVLERKREEYYNYIRQYYDKRNEDVHQEVYRQIHIDIPRMSPLVPIFQQETVQEIFERILYIWAIRRPASGYVQGMNDLVTPFFVVFLQEILGNEQDIESFTVSKLPESTLKEIEADSFWCMSKLLDGIQDNYTFAQPGIQIKINSLKELICRINEPLHEHLVKHNVEYIQFTFRWMNNLLMRELPLRCTIRLWDTYQAEPDNGSTFHLYVCAAFLNYWSNDLLKERDFQSLMIHLQNLPTQNWGDKEISELVAEAYRLKFIFADAPSHFQGSIKK